MNLRKLIQSKQVAFTLAEVVVVMAILGVMMAAFAPVITKRTLSVGGNNKITFDVMNGHTGIYYGTGSDTKSVVIGDNSITDNMPAITPKLILVGDDNSPQMTFGHRYTPAGGTETTRYYGQLLFDTSGNIIFGGRYDTTNSKINAVDVFSENNTIIGYNTLPNQSDTQSVKSSTIIGANACSNYSQIENMICIGYNSGPTAWSTGSGDRIFIGDNTKAYSAEYGINFGDKSLADIITNHMAASDIRLKNVGKEFTGGLDEINQLTFYNYTYKRDADKTPRVGVMAQDLQKVFPNAVAENKDGYLYIRKDDMFYAALNSIKDLFKKMTDNSAKIKALEERNAVLEKQVKELQDLYIDLANKVDKKAAKKKLTITPEKPITQEIEAVPTDEQQTGESMPD